MSEQQNFKTETNDDEKYGKTISILKEEKRVVSFGIKKAIAIVANIEAIKAFVEANSNDNSKSN